MSAPIQQRQADAKGRITLGPAYANQLMLIEEREDGIVLRVGKAIPARESWLYENERALAAVRRGLAEARAGDFDEGPDLESARRVADAAWDDDAARGA